MASATETDSRPTRRRKPIYQSLFFQVFVAPAPVPAPAGASAPAGAQS
jgi:hypothetical protein